ncbi:uncharacterized protein MEPE_06070 [Melanopsichium pennsylvanicum]|uniref:Uncharacterized protein n=1 Tax=Melanopsichium pennsylvanicum TaxID=63383 RepID=A0AAJ5C7W3_9BASI|nr:uncharacterized protein MEPE_06070 [Melanopsichium pennsylvanicum]
MADGGLSMMLESCNIKFSPYLPLPSFFTYLSSTKSKLISSQQYSALTTQSKPSVSAPPTVVQRVGARPPLPIERLSRSSHDRSSPDPSQRSGRPNTTLLPSNRGWPLPCVAYAYNLSVPVDPIPAVAAQRYLDPTALTISPSRLPQSFKSQPWLQNPSQQDIEHQNRSNVKPKTFLL